MTWREESFAEVSTEMKVNEMKELGLVWRSKAGLIISLTGEQSKFIWLLLLVE